MRVSEAELVSKVHRSQRILKQKQLSDVTILELAEELVDALAELKKRGFRVEKRGPSIFAVPDDCYIMATGESKSSHKLREDVFFYLYEQQCKYIEVGHIQMARYYEATIAALIKEWQVCGIFHQSRKLRFKEEL